MRWTGRIGCGEPVYNATEEPYEIADIAVYIHEQHRIALVWNLKRRRELGRVIKSFSVSESWNELKIEPLGMKAIYKRTGSAREAPFEKVLVLDAEVLYEEVMPYSYG